MPISAKRKLVAGAAGLAVLAGSGGAYAAGQTSSAPKQQPAKRAAEQKAFLDDVAKRLNVSPEALNSAIKGAAEARIDAAVAAGKLTKAQGDAAKQRLASGAPLLGPGLLGGPRGGPRGGGPGFGPGPGRRGFGHGPFGLDAAATYLGLTEAKLHEQLHAGKSLADIAKATNGKSVDGLKAALKAGVTAKLDQAVKDGHLTAAQKSKILARLDARLDEIVNRTPPAGGPRGRHRWR